MCKNSARNITGTVLSAVAAILLLTGIYFLNKHLSAKHGKIRAAKRAVKSAIKILFVTYQILASLPTIIPAMKLPTNFRTFLDSIQFANLNLFQIISIGCISKGFNFYSQMLVMALVPIFLIGLLVVLGLLKRNFRAQCFTIALAVSYVVVPTSTTIIFKAFPCDTFSYGKETVSYLRADYSISCDDPNDNYQTFRALAILGIFIFPVGIPSAYAYILWKKKELIKQSALERSQNAELMTVSFLFDSYKPQFWWFELFETCRRLLLTGALGAIKPGTITQLVRERKRER